MKSQKNHFDQVAAEAECNEVNSGIWELPADLVELVAGGDDFTQGSNFAQNFSCFAQNIGPYGGPTFSQGTPPFFG